MQVYRISCPIKQCLLSIHPRTASHANSSTYVLYTFPVTTAFRLARNTIYIRTYMMEWYTDASIIQNVYQANTLIRAHIQESDQLHRVQQKLAWQCGHEHMRTSIHVYMHNAHTSPHAQYTHQPTCTTHTPAHKHNAHTSPHCTTHTPAHTAQRTHQPTCTTHTPAHTAQRTHQPTLHPPLTLHIALRVLVVPGVLVLTLILRLEDLLQGLGRGGVVDRLRFLLAAEGL